MEEQVVALEAVEADALRVPSRLVDLTRVTRLDLTFADVQRFADRRRRLRFKNAFKVAALAYDPVATGFAEMYRALSENPQIAMRVFYNREPAPRWLAEC